MHSTLLSKCKVSITSCIKARIKLKEKNNKHCRSVKSKHCKITLLSLDQKLKQKVTIQFNFFFLKLHNILNYISISLQLSFQTIHSKQLGQLATSRNRTHKFGYNMNCKTKTCQHQNFIRSIIPSHQHFVFT